MTSLTGLLDQSFNVRFDTEGSMALLMQPDGKIIVHGAFNQVNGTNRPGLARLNPDGTLDLSFDAGVVPTYEILVMAVQPDGRILIGGSFTEFNGIAENGLVRLNSNGSRDASFNVQRGPTFTNNTYSPVFDLALQADGKIIVGGDFAFFNGVAAHGVARLMSDGTVDKTFDSSRANLRWVHNVAVQSDGKILVGFVYGLNRFNADGSLDQNFGLVNPGGVSSLWVLPDGKILVAGPSGGKVSRLLPDGSLDSSFSAFGFGRNNFIIVDQHQRILVGGIPIGMDDTFGLVRLYPDGTRDDSFDLWTELEGPIVQTAAVQPDGKILIAGQFTSIDGVPRNSIARLNDTNLTSTILFASTNLFTWETSTNVAIPVVRHGNLQNPATVVYFTEDATAKAGTQYVGQYGKIEFMPGDRTNTITVPLIADQKIGPLISDFNVVLSHASGDAGLNGAYSRASVTIQETDQFVELDSTNYFVSGSASNLTVTVKRNGPFVFPGNLLVDYDTYDVTAKSGIDYQAVSGTLTFVGWDFDRPGPSQLNLTIPVFQSAAISSDRVFALSLSNVRLTNSTGKGYPSGLFADGVVFLGQMNSAKIALLGNQGPELGIVQSGPNLVFSWPTNWFGFALQSAIDLKAPGNWVEVGGSATIIDGQFNVSVRRGPALQFYRLKK